MEDILKQYLRHSDCKFFEGDKPCREHKMRHKRCPCDKYIPVKTRILIIKLGAAGDVIRTTPLIYPLKDKYENSYIYWLSYFPELLPPEIDTPLKFSTQNVLFLLASKFDILINLDKDREAISLANLIKAKSKYGFHIKEGKCAPINKLAEEKFLNGLDDTINKKNTKSYPEEIFHICGFKYNKEPYILHLNKHAPKLKNVKRPIVGLNTGCGKRWASRLWPEKHWVKLAKMLKKEYSVIILGGAQEDKKNRKIAKESGVCYLGYFPLKEFIALVNECDMVVTQVSLALHIAIGLKKKIVLMNNVFNKNEFELYGLGKIIEPDVKCLGCYKNSCGKKCMELIKPNIIFKEIKQLI